MAENSSHTVGDTKDIIFECLATYKNNQSLSDVLVVVGSSEFYCHRVILAAVSKYFQNAFDDQIREATENKILLDKISPEIFSKILACIYEGKYILSEENLFQVWSAAISLQITFLLTQCDTFFKKNVSRGNFLRYYCEMREISKTVHALDPGFFRRVFAPFSYHLIMLGVDEIKDLVSNDQLKTTSEDYVIETVLTWAELQSITDRRDALQATQAITMCESAGPSQPKRQRLALETTSHQVLSAASPEHHLADVLECTRYLLITHTCLDQTLACHPLVMADDRCQAIVDKIKRYRSVHQSWCPPAGIHRQSSDVASVLMTRVHNASWDDKVLAIMHPDQKEWKRIQGPKGYYSLSRLFCHDNKIFLHFDDKITYSFAADKWNNPSRHIGLCLKLPLFCLIGDYMYTVGPKQRNSSVTVVRRLSMSSDHSSAATFEEVCEASAGECDVKALTSVDNILIIFSRKELDEGYNLECINLSDRKAYPLRGQLGSTSHSVTFRKDKEAFALQNDGSLWRIQPCEDPPHVKITQHGKKLWKDEDDVEGAVLLNDQLFVLGRFMHQTKAVESLDVSLSGVFNVVNMIRSRNENDDHKNLVVANVSRSLLDRQ